MKLKQITWVIAIVIAFAGMLALPFACSHQAVEKRHALYDKAYSELSEAINNKSAALSFRADDDSDQLRDRITEAKSVLYSSNAKTPDLEQAKSSLSGKKNSTRKNYDWEDAADYVSPEETDRGRP